MIICQACNSSFRKFSPQYTCWDKTVKGCPACGTTVAEGSFFFAPDMIVLIQRDVEGLVIAKFHLAAEYTAELPEQIKKNKGFDGDEYPYYTHDILFLADWITEQGMVDINVDPDSIDSFTLLFPNERDPLRVYQVNKNGDEGTLILLKVSEAVSS